MNLDRFLNLIATIFGSIGAIYVMLGVLATSPEFIANLSSTYIDFSSPQIESLIQQKADNFVGFVFVFISFILSAFTIIFIPEEKPALKSKAMALAISVVLAGCLYVTLNFASKEIQRHDKYAVGKIIVAQELQVIFKVGQVTQADSDSLHDLARDLLSLDVKANEPFDSLLQRTAKIVGVNVPAKLDYSAVKSEK